MSREDVTEEDQVGCDIASMGDREIDEKESEGVVSLDGDKDEMLDEERKQFEADKLASMCYCEKLNSKDEDEDEGEVKDDKPEKVKFADTVVVCLTYTSQEYDREPDDDWREKERAVEEMVEKLDIVILETDPVGLEGVKFVDFHKMLENDEELICDFGVYVSEVDACSEGLNQDIRAGDLVLRLDDQDFLNSTSAKFKNHLGKVSKTRVTLTLGRNSKKK